MPRVIELADAAAIELGECIAALDAHGFAPRDEESLLHAARQLRRLGNNRTFLGDIIVAELASGRREETAGNSYGPQVIMLAPPDGGEYFMRANLWPSRDEYMLRASGGPSFVYGLAHDHNFDFLTLGYFGPGYWSDYYEFEYEDIAGWRGEPAGLRPIGRRRLEEGMLMHYRAHRDVHVQHPADALSVSINIMHASGAQGWLDQYRFDCETGRVGGILSNGSSEAFMRIAVGLGGEEARDLAEAFGRGHPSDRMRLACWGAMASLCTDPHNRDAVWRRAELSGSRLVAGEAKAMRAQLPV